jgi:inhibitor of cysteine peptidase
MFAYPAALVLALATATPAPAALPTLAPALMKTAMPTFGPNHSQIAVKVNQPFQIRMNVTSGTGYSWQPQGPIAPGLALLGVFQQPHGKLMPGGPGVEVLVFRASGAGTFALPLEYVRPWERGVQPAKLRAFTVTAHR